MGSDGRKTAIGGEIMAAERQTSSTENLSKPAELWDSLSADSFRDWYRERQHRRNIENGTPYFNESGYIPDPERHSPSKLLQCHRKVVYQQNNAPAEKPDPDGIFWFGTRFEEEIVFSFLKCAVTGSDTYVQNSMWIDLTVDTAAGELRIKGSTDPVIVDRGANPILPTEIKTKSSIKHLSSPSPHHVAQLHAYMVGLSEEYEVEVTDGVLIYGCRESLNTKFFHVEFDEQFWNDIVLEWATNHTQYRLDCDLPPADPEQDWECQFCTYRERCGEGQSPYSDVGVTGILPGFSEYPREKIVEYLRSHPTEKLTLELARQYPDLVASYDVMGWHCGECDSEVDWKTAVDATDPLCPYCADNGKLSNLSQAVPDEIEPPASPNQETTD